MREHERLEARPKIRLERGCREGAEALFDLEETLQGGVAIGCHARRVLGEREARENLRLAGRFFECREPGHPQIADRIGVSSLAVGLPAGVQKVPPEILLSDGDGA